MATSRRSRPMVLQKDIVIPAGTVFECCDGMTRRFVSDNYEAIVGLSKDSSGSLVYSIDPRDPGLVGLFKEQTP